MKKRVTDKSEFLQVLLVQKENMEAIAKAKVNESNG